jgi:hypothetical protein
MTRQTDQGDEMRSTLAAGAVVLALATFGAGAAAAKDGDLIRQGACSAGSDWKLKLSPEDGQIEAELEVDQNVDGQRWNAKIKHNGVLAVKRSKTTKPPSGSFELRRVVANAAGADVVVGKARNLTTGETCRGQATFPA